MDGQIDAHAHKNNKKQHKKLKPAVLQMSTKARNEPWKGKGNNINRTRQHKNFSPANVEEQPGEGRGREGCKRQPQNNLQHAHPSRFCFAGN
jgi:hypothetical protein